MEQSQVIINFFDGVIFAILFFSCLISFVRGFVKETLSLAAWVSAAIITLYNAEKVSSWLAPHVGKPVVATVLGTLCTYFFSLIFFSMLNRVIGKYTKSGKDVGILDNLLGMVFGFAKGTLIIVLSFFSYSTIVSKEEYPTWMKSAKTLPYVERTTAAMVNSFPNYFKDFGIAAKNMKAIEDQNPKSNAPKDIQILPEDMPNTEEKAKEKPDKSEDASQFQQLLDDISTENKDKANTDETNPNNKNPNEDQPKDAQ